MAFTIEMKSRNGETEYNVSEKSKRLKLCETEVSKCLSFKQLEVFSTV